jgi:hexosaminidase
LLAPTFKIQLQAPTAVLSAASRRIEVLLFSHGGQELDVDCHQKGVKLASLLVTVSAAALAGDTPQAGGDESYSLDINEDRATLKSVTVQGALHGLQTFAQLTRFDYNLNAVVIDSAPWAIHDSPRFSYRGLMLDTSRHFYPPSSLIMLLDAMATVKLNAFHWHISDSVSFPLVVPGTNLSAGAYMPSQRYSRTDVETIVQAATARGIRVIPEFDLPAHTAPAWCVGEPALCTASKSAVDPSSARLYEVIDRLIQYAASIFPDEYIHLGG